MTSTGMVGFTTRLNGVSPDLSGGSDHFLLHHCGTGYPVAFGHFREAQARDAVAHNCSPLNIQWCTPYPAPLQAGSAAFPHARAPRLDSFPVLQSLKR
jgi:hypothetical protein